MKLALDELLTLPRSGKTAGADHRVALYTMLGYLPPTRDVSPTVVEAGPALLTKETHDGAISVLTASLARHIVFCLLENVTIPAGTQTAIARDMNAAKPPVRRAFSSLVGNVLWELRDLRTQAALDFAKAVLPSLETSLKTVAASPAAPPAGPLEGYIAVALLLGPYHSSGKFGRYPVVFPVLKHISEFILCVPLALLVMQKTWLVGTRHCRGCSPAARSRPSYCGRKSTRSSLSLKIKPGYFVLGKLSCRSTRVTSSSPSRQGM